MSDSGKFTFEAIMDWEKGFVWEDEPDFEQFRSEKSVKTGKVLILLFLFITEQYILYM